jgi:hypothetical protein
MPIESPALTPSPRAQVAVNPKLPEPPPDLSPWDLSPDQYELWEERVCIMHFDEKLPWKEAETLALADVLGQTAPQNETDKPAGNAAGLTQGRLFAVEQGGPYGRE